MQGLFHTDLLEGTFEPVVDNAPATFPDLPGYKHWMRRLSRLTGRVGRLRLLPCRWLLIATYGSMSPIRCLFGVSSIDASTASCARATTVRR